MTEQLYHKMAVKNSCRKIMIHMETNLNFTYKIINAVLSHEWFSLLWFKAQEQWKKKRNWRNNKEKSKVECIVKLSMECIMHWYHEYCMQLVFSSVNLRSNWEKSREKKLVWLKSRISQSGKVRVYRKMNTYILFLKNEERQKKNSY